MTLQNFPCVFPSLLIIVKAQRLLYISQNIFFVLKSYAETYCGITHVHLLFSLMSW